MLTVKEERFCQNLEVKQMTQRAAYLDAYPNSKTWKDSTVDSKACRLAAEDKIRARRKEIRAELAAEVRAEAKWTRDDAFRELQWLLTRAKNEASTEGTNISGPCVSAITNAVKELNTIYAVQEATEGKGVLEGILAAVRGIDA